MSNCTNSLEVSGDIDHFFSSFFFFFIFFKLFLCVSSCFLSEFFPVQIIENKNVLIVKLHTMCLQHPSVT